MGVAFRATCSRHRARHRASKVQPYLDAGYGVFLVGYRGYGANPGKVTEKGLYDDAVAALSYLKSKGITQGNIILYGESLGTGIAVHLAEERTPAALVLEAPFSSIADVAQARMPLLPVKYLLLDRFESTSKIVSVTAPTLIVHGAHDGTIPLRFGQKLFAVAREPKTMHVYAEAGHNDLYEHGMATLVIDFLGAATRFS